MLHRRIERFSVKHPELGQYLLAAKWLGNEGAHDTSTINEVLIAADLIEEVLLELYTKRRETLRKQASKINKNKGSMK